MHTRGLWKYEYETVSDKCHYWFKPIFLKTSHRKTRGLWKYGHETVSDKCHYMYWFKPENYEIITKETYGIMEVRI